MVNIIAEKIKFIFTVIVIGIIVVISFLIGVENGIGYGLLYIIWPICFILLLIPGIIAEFKPEKNYKYSIINFSLIYSIVALLLGIISVKITNNYSKYELFIIADKIDNSYKNNNNMYNEKEINKILIKHRKVKIKLYEPFDEYGEYYQLTTEKIIEYGFIIYNSRTKEIIWDY